MFEIFSVLSSSEKERNIVISNNVIVKEKNVKKKKKPLLQKVQQFRKSWLKMSYEKYDTVKWICQQKSNMIHIFELYKIPTIFWLIILN